MRLHILSDLHLGVAAFAPPTTDADVVILAGDIARPAQAHAFARGFGKPVVYVAGNHEFYGGSLDGTMAELRTLAADGTMQVLECEACAIDGVRFLGATLWTDFMLFGPGAERSRALEMALRYIRDFSRIRRRADEGDWLTPEDTAAMHRTAVAWLAHQLDQPFDGATVVVTHHAPSPRSIHPRFAGSPINAGFVSDLERLLDGRAALWIHGHTHDSFDYSIGGTRVVCNPRGYARDGVVENAAFDAGLIVEV